jgi:hypothetical protein
MGGLEKATISGLNEFLDFQRKETSGKTYVTVTYFDEQIHPAYVGEKLHNIPPISQHGDRGYRTGGWGTALLDAVGVSIRGAERWVANKRGFKGQVLTVIWTDGLENSSKEYNKFTVNSLITTKQSQGWIFQFLGTGAEGWRSAETFSAIPWSNRVHLDSSPIGQTASYATLDNATTSLRSNGSWGYTQDSYDEEVANRS